MLSSSSTSHYLVAETGDLSLPCSLTGASQCPICPDLHSEMERYLDELYFTSTHYQTEVDCYWSPVLCYFQLWLCTNDLPLRVKSCKLGPSPVLWDLQLSLIFGYLHDGQPCMCLSTPSSSLFRSMCLISNHFTQSKMPVYSIRMARWMIE